MEIEVAKEKEEAASEQVSVRRKVLVLDLDETLIHSHFNGPLSPPTPSSPPDFIVRVKIEDCPVRFFVHKRPHVDFFLDMVSQWYDVVIFTASMEHCTVVLNGYTKDLTAVSPDLSSVFIVDNSPAAYRQNPDNAIPIKSWFSDPHDTALLDLLPMLDALRFTQDVRSILSRNLHLHSLW